MNVATTPQHTTPQKSEGAHRIISFHRAANSYDRCTYVFSAHPQAKTSKGTREPFDIDKTRVI
jgi:hypothetical protein